MKIFLETKRLIVCPPTPNAVDLVHRLDADPDVMRYISNGQPRSKEQSLIWYEKSIKHYEKHGFTFGLAYEKQSGIFIGRAGISYNAYDDTQPDIEVGYRLFKDFWHQGYATELASALIAWGFSTIQLQKICGFAKPDNHASRHVLEKVGMHLVGIDTYGNEEVVRYEILQQGNK